MTNAFNNLSPDQRYILYAGIAALVAVLFTVKSFFRFDAHSRRLKALQERRAALRGEMAQSQRRRFKPESHMTFMRQVVNRFNLLKSDNITQIQQLLLEAGWRSKDAVVAYLFFMLILPMMGAMAGLVVSGFIHWNPQYRTFRFAMPLAGAYLGMKLPGLATGWKRKKRYTSIRRSLSDALDLMTICAEAGLTLAVAIDRVGRELGLTYPAMAEELALTSMEMGLLPERNKALTNLAERVKIPEIRGVVNVLVQTEKYGTPIAQALRVLSSEFREQRMLMAENKAAKLGPMMTVPMIMFILPTMFIIVIAPAAIRLTEQMGK